MFQYQIHNEANDHPIEIKHAERDHQRNHQRDQCRRNARPVPAVVWIPAGRFAPADDPVIFDHHTSDTVKSELTRSRVPLRPKVDVEIAHVGIPRSAPWMPNISVGIPSASMLPNKKAGMQITITISSQDFRYSRGTLESANASIGFLPFVITNTSF